MRNRGSSAALRQRGYVLFTVVVMLVVVAVGALLVSYDSSLNARLSAGEAEASRADYVAEAAMQHALWQSANNACMGDVTIPTTALGSDSYTAAITGAATGTAYTLTADQDAWIRSDIVTSNNGANADQLVKFELGNVEHALTRFNLSSLPADAQINSATAWFYVTPSGPGGGAHPEGPLTVHRVTADWTETGATWETMNGNFESSRLATIPAQPVNAVWVSINLTAQVQAWVNGQPNYGILMASESEGVHGKYASREGAANEQPYIEIVVGSGPSSPVNIQATGTLANGNTRSLTRAANAAYQPPVIVTLQLGADPGADATLDDFYPRNYGGRDFATVSEDTGNWLQRAVFRFDLGGIPAHSAVLSARLELRIRNIAAPGTATVHRVTRSWLEGTKSGTGQADGATWATYDGINNWTTAGSDFNAAPVAETAINTSETWFSWEIGSLVEQWLAGEPNDGLLIKGDAVLREAEFSTQEHANPTLHPKLTITYACECGSACMAPSGSGNVLFVVADPANLLGVDAYKESLIESWGYTVTLIDDNAAQGAFSTELAANDVVYISASVASGTAAGKISNVTIGIVNEEGPVDGDLGFSSAQVIPVPVGDSLDITDNSHYITRIFPAGSLQIYAADMGGHAASGALAPGLQSLALWGTNPGLAVIDTGAALGGTQAGLNAKGRLVLVPFGQDNTHDWSKLNNNGHLIMQRALQWGSDNTGPVAGYNVLLIVGNHTTLVSKDVGYKALMESWGHAVTVIDDGASQADYDTAMAAADVIYASGSSLGANMLDKATYTTKGLVNEVNGKIDNFGFSSSATATVNFDTFSASDAAHYITEPFGGNPVTVFASSLTNPVPGGTLAPDLQNVGEVSGTLALVTLDSGATGWNGNPVPARRAHLPFASAETTDMTADGKTILQRAIEWAAGAGVNALAPIAHWKLDDGAGSAAVDSIGNNDGTLVDNPAWVAGKIGDALDFDGVNDYVDAGSFDVSGNGLTLMSWFKAETIPTSDGRFISKASGGNDFDAWWQLSTTDSGSNRYLRMRVKAGGTTTTFADSSVNLQTAQWYFAVATYNNSGVMKLYLDGVEVASGMHAVGGPVDTSPAVPVAIGANGTAERFFDGVLDDVRVYDRALGATEISDLFTAGGGGGGGGGGGTFRDEFNTLASYAGDDGSLSWGTDWLEINESDGAGGGDERVLSGPDDNVARVQDNDGGGEGLQREANLSGYATATLTFTYWRGGLDNANDYVTIEVSDNGGSTWTEIDRIEGPASDPQSSPQSASYDISAYIAATTRIRFLTSPNMGGSDRVYFDDVQIAVSN